MSQPDKRRLGGGIQTEATDVGKVVGEQGYLSWLKQVARRRLTAFGLVRRNKHSREMDPSSEAEASSTVDGDKEEHNGNNFKVSIIKWGQAALHFLWQNTYLKGKMKSY